MCQLIETLRMTDGRIERLPYHELRYGKAMRHFFSNGRHRRLLDILTEHGFSETNDASLFPGVYKVHVDYDGASSAVSAVVYRPKHVATLRLVTDDDIDYSFKYSDRDALKHCLDKSAGCDEVIIVRHGLLTDTSYSNIAFFDGSSWFTPCTPLLFGTRRASLLDEGRLRTADIRPADLKSFSKVSLINAMLPLDALSVTTDKIFAGRK